MRRILRVLVYVVLSLVVLGLLVAGGLWFAGDRALAARVNVPAEAFDARGGNVARGRHFVTSVGHCSGCHGAGLGGTKFIDNPNLAVLYAPNLTSGAAGIGARFSDTDFERAIRHGVAPDGTRLVIMPADQYNVLSDADLRDIIAYVRSLPPVERATKPRAIGSIGHLLVGVGVVRGKALFPADHIDQSAAHVGSLPPAADANYGRYLVHLANCMGCHGVNLAGGDVEGTPAPNITPAAIGSWTLAQFEQTLRTGRDPSGHSLSKLMPWPEFSQMNDQELTALYAFLKTVPPVTKPKT